MSWSREQIDQHLSALDNGVVMMRAQSKSDDQILASFWALAKRIREGAGEDTKYVSARLLAILAANGLYTKEHS